MLLGISFPLIIDGGLSNALEAQGFDLNHPLWSAQLLDKHPEAIVQAHLSYLEAGAQCIITASYQASIAGFLKARYSEEKAKTLLVSTVALAQKAVTDFLTAHPKQPQPFIAASIGPYGAFLADGSEYRGNYAISDIDLHAFHQERIHLLAQTAADIFACETIPSYGEAQILSDILSKTDKPAWVSFACKDEQHICDGTEIAKAVALFQNHPKVFAVGVNCTDPQYIAALIKIIKAQVPDKKVVVYPNAGLIYDAHSKTWSSKDRPQSFVNLAKTWITLGADIIGGCCQVGPACIREIQQQQSSLI